MLNITKNKNWFFTFSAILVGLSVAAIAIWGLKPGIDFTGGTLWQIKTDSDVEASRVEELVKGVDGYADTRISVGENGDFYLRLPETSEESHQKLKNLVSGGVGDFEELSFQSIGPSVSEELTKKSYIAIVLVLLGISLYIAFAFRRVSRPVASWKYGLATLLSLFHDVIVPAGLIAYMGHTAGVEVDTNFIVALLVVMGFSVHDTIVVFDRIRENLILAGNKKDFNEVINESVNQTIACSINTSLTLVFVLVALYLVGPTSLQYFMLTLLVGTITGIYSSIFIASPILSLMAKGDKK